jgi:hypothetical protein
MPACRNDVLEGWGFKNDSNGYGEIYRFREPKQLQNPLDRRSGEHQGKDEYVRYPITGIQNQFADIRIENKAN